MTAEPELAAGAASLRPERGDLGAFVAAFKDTIPGQDSNAFVDPSPADVAQMVSATCAALAGSLEEAAARLDSLGYDLVPYQDTSAGGSHLMLRERAPYARCWGLYVLRLAPSAQHAVVEVPHPIWDVFTPEMGLEAYQRLGARAFLLAGAHRYANGKNSPISDLARNDHSVFQGLHEALTDPDCQVLQYHGFDIQVRPEYPNVVLSNGSAQPQPEHFRLKAAMEARGESVGIYDGLQWSALAATGNPQARYTRSIGGRFYHLEHRYAIRKQPPRRSAMIEAAIEVLFP
jgi:hypothetical protein